MASVATGRSKRATAGNRMAKLINGEEPEKDEFYETAYGGFKETEGDGEYKEEHEVEDDTIDSDFDAAEEDASKVEQNGDAKPVKRTSEANGNNATTEEEPAAKVRKEEVGKEANDSGVVVVEEETKASVVVDETKEAPTTTAQETENQAEVSSVVPNDGEKEVGVTTEKVEVEIVPSKTEEAMEVAAVPTTTEEVKEPVSASTTEEVKEEPVSALSTEEVAVAEVPKETVAVVDAEGDSPKDVTSAAEVEETVPVSTTEEVGKEAASEVEVQQTE